MLSECQLRFLGLRFNQSDLGQLFPHRLFLLFDPLPRFRVDVLARLGDGNQFFDT